MITGSKTKSSMISSCSWPMRIFSDAPRIEVCLVGRGALRGGPSDGVCTNGARAASSVLSSRSGFIDGRKVEPSTLLNDGHSVVLGVISSEDVECADELESSSSSSSCCDWLLFLSSVTFDVEG